jgi:carbonic anhydrase
MQFRNKTVVLVFAAMPVLALAAGSGAHWGYEGHEGPAHWGEMYKDYAQCRLGHKQSPIDISVTTKENLPVIEFNYRPSPLKIVNNGHTVQVNVADGSGIQVGTDRYQLVQFHVHTPSEEQVQGRSYDMVVHFVHKNMAGQLAVVGVLFEKGQENMALAPIVAALPKQAGPERIVAGVGIDAAKLLPANHGYYTFEGSLTTPPCSEGVRWLVLKSPVQASAAQLAAIQAIVHHNARPVQPLHGRVVKESL